MTMEILGYVGGKKLFKKQPGNIKKAQAVSDEEYERLFLKGD